MQRSHLARYLDNPFGEYFRRVADSLLWAVRRTSNNFWNSHYRLGGTSGPGSFGALADYKAKFVNDFVQARRILSLTDFGCGDGNQLLLLECPAYVGLDTSKIALERCIELFSHDRTKSFFLYNPLTFVDRQSKFRSELSISLDVIFHLIEDTTYEAYMDQLFDSASRYVIVYSSNRSNSDGEPRYSKHRSFLEWVRIHKANWELIEQPDHPFPEKTSSRFFVFQRVETEG